MENHFLYPAFLILFGVAKLSFYYSRFNVNIITFLDFSEIITSFLDFILIAIYSISMTVFLLPMGFAVAWPGKKLRFISILTMMVIFVAYLGFLVAVGQLAKGYLDPMFAFVLFVFLLTILLTLLSRDQDPSIKRLSIGVLFCGILTSFLAMLWWVSYLDAKPVLNIRDT